MATVPSTIVVFTEDKKNFPIKYAAVEMKQLFQYGVREMIARGDRIYISLTYSPRSKTLKRKFGNLPVKYMRAKIDKEEEFKILESVVKRYKFNLLSEELEDMERNRIESSAAIPESSGIKRRKRYLELPPSGENVKNIYSSSSDDDDDDDDNDDNEEDEDDDLCSYDSEEICRLLNVANKSSPTVAVAAPTTDLVATSTAAPAAPGGKQGGGSGEGGGQKKKRKNSPTKIILSNPTQTPPVTSDLLSSLLEVGLEILPPPPTSPAPSQSTTEQ
ncbi:unnamed protein product [Callosobruchus maculatus]|uniref:Uncharacterized protein n=1 Tax=Callosobruchus maculatus TaxID=64391 RepID=A0A653D7P6_CALMS|nr:unnamed protein product [Callosobruchus maculatus]